MTSQIFYYSLPPIVDIKLLILTEDDTTYGRQLCQIELEIQFGYQNLNQLNSKF